MKMTESEYRVEQDRQTTILSNSIDEAVYHAAEGFPIPMLNAVIGALVANLANSISSIEDAKTRKQMRLLVEKELQRQIAAYVASGKPSSKVMIVDGGLN